MKRVMSKKSYCYQINLQFFASKKGVGSTKNGRDSHSKRLGAKKADGQMIRVGQIIYRQRGTKIFAGQNVAMGSDNTLFALSDGIVRFQKFGSKQSKTRVNIIKHQLNA